MTKKCGTYFMSASLQCSVPKFPLFFYFFEENHANFVA